MPQGLRRVVFHEVAHAWFGQLVSPDGKTFPWFHEALANMSTGIALDQHEGSEAGNYWRAKQAAFCLMQRTILTYYKGSLFYDSGACWY